jgi:PAS domain S-box-containing protein
MKTGGIRTNSMLGAIPRRFILCFIATGILSMLFSLGVAISIEYQNDTADIAKLFDEIEHSYIQSVTLSAWTSNRALLQAQINGIARLPHITRVDLNLDGENGISKSGEKGEAAVSKVYRLEYPFADKTVLLGTLTIAAGMKDFNESLKNLTWFALATQGFQSLLVAVIITLFFHYQIGRHIRRMAAYAKSLNADRLDAPLTLDRSPGSGSADELDQLALSLNEMRESLKRAFHEQAVMNAHLQDEIWERKRAEQTLLVLEKSMREMVEFAPIGIYRSTPSGRYISVNKRFAEMYGYESAAELMESVKDIRTQVYVDPSERDAIMRTLEHGDVKGVEARRRRKDGSVIWVDLSMRVVRDLTGKILHHEGFVSDITTRKKIEAEVVGLKNLLQCIIDSMPSILVGVDGQGRVTHWNHLAAQAGGLSMEEAKGRPIADILPLVADERDKIEAAIRDLRPHEVMKSGESSSGQTLVQEIAIYPLLGEGISGAVIRIDDVTERARLEDMMVQSEKMMSLGGLAAGMAHEINNPLGIILQAAQNAMRRISPALESNLQTADRLHVDFAGVTRYLEERKILDYLIDINEAGLRASKIVQSMLNFSRRSQSRRELHSVSGLLDKTLVLARSDYDLKKNYDIKKIKFVTDYDPDDPRGYFVETEIEQVFLNIIKNAAQAMAEKAYQPPEEPTVILRTKRSGARVQVDIEDNGPGMDETTSKRVLEPFFTTKAPGRGTGLGLSVTYFIVTNNYGGELHIVSGPGLGTCFKIVLPLGDTADAPAPIRP